MTKKIALSISIGILFMVSGCSNAPKQVSADSAPAVVQQPSSITNPSAPKPAVVNEPTKPEDPNPNCYDMPFAAQTSGKTAATRTAFAVDASNNMDRTLGMDTVYAITAGENKEYLLFSTSPGNENVLRQLASEMLSSKSIRANLCVQGFAEAQFLIRDDNNNQRLLRKYKTSAKETWRYIGQRGGAVPVQ
jgi:hypothetical protein